MKARILAVALAFPLLAFDCGGKEEDPPPGFACTVQVGGEVTESLWCIVSAYDYNQDPYPSPEWVFQLVAYRGYTAVGGQVAIRLTAPPALNAGYGWNAGAGTTNVVWGSEASRWVGDAMNGTQTETHRAMAPDLEFGEPGTGRASVVFTAIPPPGATGEQLVGVHGTMTGTLPSLSGGTAVTFSATF